MSLQTLHYIPIPRRDAIRDFQVRAIIAVGHSQEPWLHAYTNHWCLYLQTSDRTSVRVDMIPSHIYPSTVTPGGSKGTLVVSELDNLYSEDATQKTFITPPQGLKVAHVIDALVGAGRDKYEFDADGVGCRMWTTDSLRLLQGNGWGVVSQFDDAIRAITKLWPDGTDLPLDQGAYYTT